MVANYWHMLTSQIHTAQSVKNCLQCTRPRFNSWVRKIPWRRKWQATPVFLPGKSHEQRSLAGYSQWSYKESDTTELLNNKRLITVFVCVCVPFRIILLLFNPKATSFSLCLLKTPFSQVNAFNIDFFPSKSFLYSMHFSFLLLITYFCSCVWLYFYLFDYKLSRTKSIWSTF